MARLSRWKTISGNISLLEIYLSYIREWQNKTRTEKVEDVCNVGDTMKIKFLGVDERGRMNLSRRDALDAE